MGFDISLSFVVKIGKVEFVDCYGVSGSGWNVGNGMGL